MVSGFLGGLPVTSVIVRSSANVNAGAKTKGSAIVHGVLLLVCAASIPFLLNLIPKASLAAILLFTGYKLCKPSAFVHMWHGGMTQFVPFVATAAGVVGLDLLKGVGIGIVISIIFILKQNAQISYYMHKDTSADGETTTITLAEEVSFLNKSSIKDTLNKLPDNTNVTIDAGKSQYIDFDVLDIIKEFSQTQAPEKNIKVALVGFKESYKIPQLKHEA
jgi:MFS superfamily sulfate permease-like transporter